MNNLDLKKSFSPNQINYFGAFQEHAIKNKIDEKLWINIKKKRQFLNGAKVRDSFTSWLATSALMDCANIKLSQKITNVLLNMDSEDKFLHLPFPHVFLDTNIIIDNFTIHGLLLVDPYQSPIFSNPDLDDKCIMFFFFTTDEKGQKECFTLSTNAPRDYNNPINSKSSKVKEIFTGKKIFYLVNFINSFLNFLYFPEVEIINDSTKKQHNPEIIDKVKNSSFYISVTGKIRRYIDNFNDQYIFNRHTFCWPVRGHYKHLINNRYVNKKGQLIFVPPFYKGINGKADKKEYHLKTPEETEWKSEQRLFDLIKSLYPQQPILRHYRQVLDGLEIDIYLPVLKLGFEYNGEQHYKFIPHFHRRRLDFQKLRERDIKKNILAKHKGINLITIKYDCELTEDNIKRLIGLFC